MGQIRNTLLRSEFLYRVYTQLYRSIYSNKVKGKKKNSIQIASSKLKNSKIIIEGVNNHVQIGKHTLLNRCYIIIKGNECSIKIGEGTVLNDVTIWCEDNKSSVIIGNSGLIMGNVQLAATEGKKIVIGNDALFSDDIHIRTGDSHSIVDGDGIRINTAKDVILGNHVWVGNKVIILKGSTVGNNCVIGSGSLVTRQFDEGLALGGNPARILKENINWKFERI